MQTTLMHPELRIWFPLRLSMYDEHHLISPVGNQVMEAQVSQCYNIGDGIFKETHTIVVAVKHFLMGHCHRSAIYLKSHFSF